MADSVLTPVVKPPAKTAAPADPARAATPSRTTESAPPHPGAPAALLRSPALIPTDPPAERSGRPSFPLLPLQRKLLIGSSTHPLEREADAVAHSATGVAPPQRIRPSSPPLTEAPPAVHQVLRSPGTPLDPATRAWAEPALQSDLRSVRIHTGRQASDSAAAIHARAYTVGSNIVLGPEAPTSGPDHRRLMAHELTHVVQQGMAPPRLPSPVLQDPVPDTSGTKLGWVTEGIVDLLSAPARAVGDTAYNLVRSTWHGFFAEISSHSGEIIDKIKGRIGDADNAPPKKTTGPDKDSPTTAADKESNKPATEKKEPAPSEQQNAPPEKDNPPPDKDPKADEEALAKTRAERASRLQKIEDELKANHAKMDKLDRQIKAAEERAQESADKATSKLKDSPERKTLENNARRNRQSARDLQDERNALSTRNDQLRSERKFLTAPQTWQDAEDFLRKEFNGQKKTFHVNDELGDRNIDCFTPDLASRECKYGGPHDLSEFIEKEIKKDVALRAAGKVTKVEWHFYPDPASGFGPTARLEKALNDAGIKIVFHRF